MHPRARDESEDLGIQLRLLLHGRRNHAYRIYFLIEAEATVVITNIRHWAQAPLSAEDVPTELLN